MTHTSQKSSHVESFSISNTMSRFSSKSASGNLLHARYTHSSFSIWEFFANNFPPLSSCKKSFNHSRVAASCGFVPEDKRKQRTSCSTNSFPICPKGGTTKNTAPRQHMSARGATRKVRQTDAELFANQTWSASNDEILLNHHHQIGSGWSRLQYTFLLPLRALSAEFAVG